MVRLIPPQETGAVGMVSSVKYVITSAVNGRGLSEQV